MPLPYEGLLCIVWDRPAMDGRAGEGRARSDAKPRVAEGLGIYDRGEDTEVDRPRPLSVCTLSSRTTHPPS